METQVVEFTEQVMKIYSAVSPHIEAIGDPDLTAFCTMVKTKIDAQAEEEVEVVEVTPIEANENE